MWVYAVGRQLERRRYESNDSPFMPTAWTERLSLFKIPELHKSEILTVEGLLAPEDEFKYNVEQKGLKGLIFEQIWDSEGGKT